MSVRYRLTKLPSGVRVATAEMPGAGSASVGVWVDAGGRSEPARLCGVSHFIEHMLFKGTARRSPVMISRAIEEVGGAINAFTSEDHVCYYAQAAARHLSRVVDVLMDMLTGPKFAEDEIERERAVICDEIAMSNDQPAQRVQELLSAGVWPGHPLGRPLTGTPQTVSHMKRGALIDFYSKHYRAKSIILVAAGRVDHDAFVHLVSGHAARISEGKAPPPVRWRGARANERGPRRFVFRQDCEQTHVAIGFRACGRHDPRRHALRLVSVLLGENMSSRLFQVLRERRGYCYSISTGLATFAEAGLLTIQAGLDARNFRSTLALIYAELHKLRTKSVPAAELRRSKEYLFGQTEITGAFTRRKMSAASLKK
jgi:predicted Zn-dependent peptidase